MEQHDLQHIGDNQNSQWWGAKQGLFINELANQYGMFEADANYKATINQNTTWSMEVTNIGACILGNSFYGTNNNNTGLNICNGSDFIPGLQRSYISFLISQSMPYFSKQTAFWMNNESKPNKIANCHINFDSTIFYSQTPPTFSAFNIYKQRIKNYSIGSGFYGGNITPLYILTTDNLYPIGSTTIRLNYIAESVSGNQFNTGVIRDLRIYTRVLSSKEVTDNYHAMQATNRKDLFCEWKMAEPSDFYVYDNKLYARNTGSSGNTNQDGTGYDMQLIGYIDNIPILNSIFL